MEKLDILYSLEIEEAILGCFILNPECANQSKKLSVDVFTTEKTRTVFRAIAQLVQVNSSPDLMGVTVCLRDQEKLKTIGGAAYLTYLVERTISSYNLESYIAIAVDKYFRRRLQKLLSENADLVFSPSQNAIEIIEDLQSQVFNLRQETTRGHNPPQKVSDLVSAAYSAIEAANTGESADTSAVPTTFYDLDNALNGGLHKGTYNVLFGATESGKSCFSLELAYRVCCQNKIPVLYFALEMSRDQLTRKLMVRSAAGDSPDPPINITHVFKRNAFYENPDGLASLVSCFPELGKIPLWLQDIPSPTIADIKSDIERVLTSQPDLGLVIVDPVYLISERNNQNRYLVLDQINASLRRLAKEFNISILGITQANRDKESRNDKRPTIHDIRESAGYANESACVLGIYKAEEGTTEISILKARFGRHATIELGFQHEYGRYLNRV